MTIAVAILETFEKTKQARALLDYDDLIAKARALLTTSAMAPWVLYKLDGGIDHILVDEAQDQRVGGRAGACSSSSRASEKRRERGGGGSAQGSRPLVAAADAPPCSARGCEVSRLTAARRPARPPG